MDEKKIPELLLKARELIKDIDPELKSAAFSVVLTSLLSSEKEQISVTKESQIQETVGRQNDHPTNSSGKLGPKDRIRELISESFFAKPKSMASILEELHSRSFHYKDSDLTRQMQELVREKLLRRLKQPNEKGRVVTHWVNW